MERQKNLLSKCIELNLIMHEIMVSFLLQNRPVVFFLYFSSDNLCLKDVVVISGLLLFLRVCQCFV